MTMYLIESCLYGDKIGPVLRNGWTCRDLITKLPINCHTSAIHIKCCHSCAQYLKTTTVSHPSSTYTNKIKTTSYIAPISTSSVPPFTMSVDDQCESIFGAGSFLCRVSKKIIIHLLYIFQTEKFNDAIMECNGFFLNTNLFFISETIFKLKAV